MKRIVWGWSALAAVLLAIGAVRVVAKNVGEFGLAVQRALNERSHELFGILQPLSGSALGPYNGADSTAAIEVAQGLTVSLVSSAVQPSSDMIALWPSDEHPTALFVCDESTSNPAVERVDLSKPATADAPAVTKGLLSHAPIRR